MNNTKAKEDNKGLVVTTTGAAAINSTTRSTTTTSTRNDQLMDALNSTKSALDPKLYRQIVLPYNGLQCVLIQDTLAMLSAGGGTSIPFQQEGDDDDEDDDDDDEDDDQNKMDYKSDDPWSEQQQQRIDSTTNNTRMPLRMKKKRNRRIAKQQVEEDQVNGCDGEKDTTDEDDDDQDDDGDDSSSDMNGLRDAAACIIVGVGSMSDPISCQGLAHFLEHLLFMGSKKYPNENDYESYISKHGGYNNAYTEWEYTSYQIQIPQPYIWTALDRLAQFFIEPLLLTNSIERELLAIESEFQLHYTSDTCRWQQLICATSQLDHPIARFSWGNIHSLQTVPKLLHVDPIQEVYQFYQQHYYATNMRLVVMAGCTLDEIEKHIVPMFSPIPATPQDRMKIIAQQQRQSLEHPLSNTSTATTTSADTSGNFKQNETTTIPTNRNDIDIRMVDKNKTTIAMAGSPLDESRSLSKIFYVIGTQQRHTLMVIWPIPSQMSNWASKPADYLAHLLGHEASGSLLSYLKSQSWVTGCMAGIGDEGHAMASSHALFGYTVTLTEQGLNQWKKIIEAIYQYLGLLRRHATMIGWPDYIYSELVHTNEMSYRYRDEPSPEDVVDTIAENMAPHYQLPPNRVLDGMELLFEFNAPAIETLLDHYLIPTNARIDFMSSSFGRASDFTAAVAATATASALDVTMTDLSTTVTTTTNSNPSKEAVATTETICRTFTILKDSDSFDPKSSGPPNIEPMFGTFFWCQELSKDWITCLSKLSDPHEPTTIPISLPPPNPFVPDQFALKPLPDNDSRHPLMNSSLKVCIVVGKTKQWFPATVIQYNQTNNSVLVSYEDNEEKWHSLDHEVSYYSMERLALDFEGTMDQKQVKFRIIALSLNGGVTSHTTLGEEADIEMNRFPHIPAPSSSHHLPKQICDTNQLKMWWLQDRKFQRPIAELRLEMICGKANATPLHRACQDLLVKLCLDALTETSYLAEMCELSTSLSSTDNGFILRFHGFDDKLLELFRTTMLLVLSFRFRYTTLPNGISNDRFSVCLEILRRAYQNADLTSSHLSTSVRLQAIRPSVWSANQKLLALEQIDVALFSQTCSDIMKSLAVECLYHGNIDRPTADHAMSLIVELLDTSTNGHNDAGSNGGVGLSRKCYPTHTVLRIPSVEVPTTLIVPSKNVEDPNTAVEMYVQIGKDNLKDRVLIDLLVYLMNEPMYDQLRTREQIGYDISCDIRWSWGVMGLSFRVITNVLAAADVVRRVDQFLLDYRNDLDQMTSEVFLEHLIGLVRNKLDMFNSLSEETAQLWGEIVDGRFQWECWRDEAECLRLITKEDTAKAFDNWLLPGKRRSMMVVQAIGAGTEATSSGRPQVELAHLGEFCDDQVKAFHQTCKNQTWGRINCKLF